MIVIKVLVTIFFLAILVALLLGHLYDAWQKSELYVAYESLRAEREIDRIGHEAEVRIMADAVRRAATSSGSPGHVAHGRAVVRGGNHVIDDEAIG